MEIQQKSTKSDKASEVSHLLVDARFQALVDFKALNGLMTDEEGNMKKMSMQTLAGLLQVDRGTLYNWMKVDGFWDAVNTRRKDISPRSRLAKVHETWYLKAVQGDWQHLNAWLLNFDDNYRTPSQKVELEAGDSLMEALALARQRGNLIEAEVVDEPNNAE